MGLADCTVRVDEPAGNTAEAQDSTPESDAQCGDSSAGASKQCADDSKNEGKVDDVLQTCALNTTAHVV